MPMLKKKRFQINNLNLYPKKLRKGTNYDLNQKKKGNDKAESRNKWNRKYYRKTDKLTKLRVF